MKLIRIDNEKIKKELKNERFYKRYRKSHDEWVADTFLKKYQNDIIKSGLDNYHIKDLLFSVNITYTDPGYSFSTHPKNYAKRINKFLEKFHIHLNKTLITSNYTKKKFLQPFMWCYVDVAGSKNKKIFTEKDLLINPHHHGWLLVNPKTKLEWDSINNEEYWKAFARGTNGIENIFIEPINQEAYSLEDIKRNIMNKTNYDSKYFMTQFKNQNLSDELEFVRPINDYQNMLSEELPMLDYKILGKPKELTLFNL